MSASFGEINLKIDTYLKEQDKKLNALVKTETENNAKQAELIQKIQLLRCKLHGIRGYQKAITAADRQGKSWRTVPRKKYGLSPLENSREQQVLLNKE